MADELVQDSLALFDPSKQLSSRAADQGLGDAGLATGRKAVDASVVTPHNTSINFDLTNSNVHYGARHELKPAHFDNETVALPAPPASASGQTNSVAFDNVTVDDSFEPSTGSRSAPDLIGAAATQAETLSTLAPLSAGPLVGSAEAFTPVVANPDLVDVQVATGLESGSTTAIGEPPLSSQAILLSRPTVPSPHIAIYAPSALTNEAPTGATLSANTIAENASGGTVVGTVSGVDPDAGATFNYQKIGRAHV